MGQTASLPYKGCQLQVIGAGLPRSGTTSLTEALTIPLDGPVYHGGTQVLLREEAVVKSWTRLLETTSTYKQLDSVAMDLLKSNLDGYVATTDTPGQLYVPELFELHPQAKVVCSIRDKDSWIKSMIKMSNSALPWWVVWAVKPLPTVRLFHRYIGGVSKRWFILYCPEDKTKVPSFTENQRVTYDLTYDRHHQMLKETIPEDRLLFFDVKDGWEPLCKFLDCPVPVGIKFPHKNESVQTEKFAEKQVLRGIKVWFMACSGVVLVCAVVVKYIM